MTGSVVIAGAFAALTMALFVAVVVPPRRALAGRLRPYVSLSRSRLGTGAADASVVALTPFADDRHPVVKVFGPLLEGLASALSSVVDLADDDAVSQRLRHAGFAETSPEQYRMRQLAQAVGGVALGLTLGVLTIGSIGGTALLAGLFGFPAVTLERNRVQRSIDARRGAMRSEVSTVAQLLAVHVRSGHGPVDAVRAVSALGHGPVMAELREALGWISSGMTPQRGYDKLAEATAEPVAGRLYRLLSSSAQAGGDITEPLLAVAADVRSQRREALARSAVKRRTAMLLPLLLLIAPVMVLFVGAALPSLVLGR